MAKVTIFVSLLICCMSWTGQVYGANECNAVASGQMSGEDTCLAALRALLQDDEKYYFGTSYSSICPADKLGTIDCFTFVPVPPHTILSRMRLESSQSNPKEEMDPNNIDRWLGVRYTSPAGEYTGCDHHVVEEARNYNLNPTVDIDYTPWLTRNEPVITWDTSEDSNDQLYTLLLQDVGYGWTHSLWMNIAGNDLSSATVIKDYLAPGSVRETPNVYVFFLFKQNGRVDALSDSWRARFEASLADPMTDAKYVSQNWIQFMQDYSLSGPIAANWMTITGDLYTTQNNWNLGGVNNCAFYVNKALMAKAQNTRQFLPDSFSLSVFVRVNLVSSEITVDVCCDEETYEAKNVNLDPIGSGRILPATARTDGSTHTISLHKNKLFPNDATDFQGEYHTLIMVDVGAVGAFGSNERPYLHWLVKDIPGAAISEGTELRPYLGPGPPGDHTYYFLVYKQTTNQLLNVATYTGYQEGCDSCFFNLKLFASDNSLELVGASWMEVEIDSFVRNLYVETFGQNETAVCAGVVGYCDPCPGANEVCPSKASSFISQKLAFLIVFIALVDVFLCW